MKEQGNSHADFSFYIFIINLTAKSEKGYLNRKNQYFIVSERRIVNGTIFASLCVERSYQRFWATQIFQHAGKFRETKNRILIQWLPERLLFHSEASISTRSVTTESLTSIRNVYKCHVPLY